MSAFLEEAIDFEEFDERIDYGTRFLENVVTMSDFPVEKIEQKVRDMRKIGLGVMGGSRCTFSWGSSTAPSRVTRSPAS